MSEAITVSPDEVGSYSECGKGTGGASKLECVQTNDGSTTCIYGLSSLVWVHETFHFSNPGSIGRINNIKLYTVCAGIGIGTVYSRGAIFTAGQPLVYGAIRTLTTDWTLYEDAWATNPWTGVDWARADLNALEIGVALKGNDSHSGWCTQIYAVINVTRPYGARGQIIGLPCW